jgi:hypothetical protein
MSRNMRRKHVLSSKLLDSQNSKLAKTNRKLPHRSSEKPSFHGKQSKSTGLQPVPVSPPIPYPSNRRGLFSWVNWDGLLWKATGVRAYHQATLFRHARRTERLLRQYQILSRRQSDFRDKFWYEHYRAVHLAYQGLHSLHQLLVDSAALKFLLKTSPVKIYKHVSQPVMAIDSSCYELNQHLNDLGRIRNIMVHRRHNPLYFKASVEAYERTSARRQHMVCNMIQNKSNRLQEKLSFGPIDWKLQHKERFTRADEPSAWREILMAACDACAPRWTIEPLLQRVYYILGVQTSSRRHVETFMNANRQTLSSEAFWRMQRLLDTMMTCAGELQQLVQEITALRYYRLDRFPSSFSFNEVRLGKQLSQQQGAGAELDAVGKEEERKDQNTAAKLVTRLPVAHRSMESQRALRVNVPSSTSDKKLVAWLPTNHSTSGPEGPHVYVQHLCSDVGRVENQRPELDRPWNRDLKNVRGLVSWERWGGHEWNFETTEIYRREVSVGAAASARANLKALAQRAPSSVRHEVDDIRRSHYDSQLNANQSLHPFLRVMINSQIICFLLRTAPASIRDRTITDVGALEVNQYATMLDMQHLRKLRIMLGHLPHSSLLFQKHDMEYRATVEASSLRAQWLVRSKLHRYDVKLTSGPTSERNITRFRNKELVKLRGLVHRLAQAGSKDLTWKYPFTVVESFHETAIFMMKQFCVALRHFQRAKVLTLTILGSARWWRPQVIQMKAYQSAVQTTFLVDDLAVLRYYRVQHYPKNISQKVFLLDQDFARAHSSPYSMLGTRERKTKNKRHSAKSRTSQRRGQAPRATPRSSKGSRSVLNTSNKMATTKVVVDTTTNPAIRKYITNREPVLKLQGLGKSVRDT